MTGTRKSTTGRLGVLLAAAMMTIGAFGVTSTTSQRADAPATVSPDTLRADGSMPPPAPSPLPKPIGGTGGLKRA